MLCDRFRYKSPAAYYCSGPTTGVMQPLEPGALLAGVQLAARCRVRLVLVPPRRLLTVDGRNPGIFSVDSARRLIDQYARVLPPDSLHPAVRAVWDGLFARERKGAGCGRGAWRRGVVVVRAAGGVVTGRIAG